MTTTIGKVAPSEGERYAGTLETLELAASIVLIPVRNANPRAPSFEIHAKSPNGSLVQIGALWEKAAQETGEVYYSGKIADPSIRTIYLTAHYQRDKSINLLWSRSNPAAAQQRRERRLAA